MIASSLVSFNDRTRLGARALLLSLSMRAMSISVAGLDLLNPRTKLRRSTIGRQSWGSASTSCWSKEPRRYTRFSWRFLHRLTLAVFANTNPGVLLSRAPGDPNMGLTRGLGGRFPLNP